MQLLCRMQSSLYCNDSTSFQSSMWRWNSCVYRGHIKLRTLTNHGQPWCLGLHLKSKYVFEGMQNTSSASQKVLVWLGKYNLLMHEVVLQNSLMPFSDFKLNWTHAPYSPTYALLCTTNNWKKKLAAIIKLCVNNSCRPLETSLALETTGLGRFDESPFNPGEAAPLHGVSRSDGMQGTQTSNRTDSSFKVPCNCADPVWISLLSMYQTNTNLYCISEVTV